MGVLSSKQSERSKYASKSTKCSTCSNGNHCCTHECFDGGPSNKREKQLIKSLKQYNADYIAKWIMEYLPKSFDLDIVTIGCEANYIALCHESSKSFYERHKPPCSIWLKGYGFSKDEGGILSIVVLGTEGVGKTALTITYFYNNFLDEYESHYVENFREKKIVSNHCQHILIDIEDIGGGNEFDITINENNAIKRGRFFLILFACNWQHSFDDAILYRERILRSKINATHNWGMMMVMTKCDLKEDGNCNDLKFIDSKEVIKKAKQWNMPYVETSAKNRKNIDFLFDQVLYEYWIQTQSIDNYKYDTSAST